MLRTVQLSHEISHTGLSARNSATNLRRSGATAFRFADCREIGLRLKFSGLRVSCLVLRLSGVRFTCPRLLGSLSLRQCRQSLACPLSSYVVPVFGSVAPLASTRSLVERKKL